MHVTCRAAHTNTVPSQPPPDAFREGAKGSRRSRRLTTGVTEVWRRSSRRMPVSSLNERKREHDSTSAEWSTKRERKLKDARRTVRCALVGGGWPAHLALQVPSTIPTKSVKRDSASRTKVETRAAHPSPRVSRRKKREARFYADEENETRFHLDRARSRKEARRESISTRLWEKRA